MKSIFLSVAVVLYATGLFAQIGVGTTSPDSTPDVRGSLSVSLPVTAVSNFYEILSDGAEWRRIYQVK